MEYLKVLSVSELPEGQMVKVDVRGKGILIVHSGDSYYAVASHCTHLGGPLAKGDLEGSIVTCPRHGARFDVKTGKAVREAKIAMIRMGVKDLKSYPVQVKGTEILVGVPEQA